MTDVVLVPGLWLDGSTWDQVVPGIEQAGHRARPLTLPGMQDRAADRSAITLQDHVDAVVAAIDAADSPVVLVGHSGGAAVAWCAVDARPDRVSRVVMIGGFPSADGEAVVRGLPAENGEVPFPGWDAFDDDEKRHLDDEALAAFAARSIPSPEGAVVGPVRLVDDRRLDVPVTMICPEYTADQMRAWLAAGESNLAELARVEDLTYVDLPTSHWPQLTRPAELAAAIVDAAGSVPGN